MLLDLKSGLKCETSTESLITISTPLHWYLIFCNVLYCCNFYTPSMMWIILIGDFQRSIDLFEGLRRFRNLIGLADRVIIVL